MRVHPAIFVGYLCIAASLALTCARLFEIPGWAPVALSAAAVALCVTGSRAERRR